VRLHLSTEQVAQIKALPAQFPVVRKGLNSNPREMRLGIGPWSQHQGLTKVSLTIVDHVDTPPKPGFLAPLLPNIEFMLMATNERIKMLTKALEAKGIIDSTLLDGLSERVSERLAGPFSELWKVADLDQWTGDDD
jgi:hypothetical protein